MKIRFSFQMREMPKHTANMNAVTSRANQQYSVVDMFLQLTRFSGFSYSGACQLSAFSAAAVHMCDLCIYVHIRIRMQAMFFFLSGLAKILIILIRFLLWYRDGVSLKAYFGSMKGEVKIQSYFVTAKNYFGCKRT